MVEINLEYITSFNKIKCIKYCKTGKKKLKGICKTCGLFKAQHMLKVADDDEECDDTNGIRKSIILLAQLFCDIRNLRIAVINFFGWSGHEINSMMPCLISNLTESILAVEIITDIIDIDLLIEAGQELVGYLDNNEDGNIVE